MLLSVSDIVGRRGSFQVGPVSFELKSGERLGVLGKSGSGKSTLLRLLSGFEPLHSGEVRIPGHVLAPSRAGNNGLPAYRQQVVYVAQHTWLWPHKTVRENVAFASRMLKLERTDERVRALLDAFEITDLADRRPWEISGGEARRTVVARALAVQPRVLLCDEIETGLDPVRAQQQMELIQDACRNQDLAMVIVTHNVATIERFTDRIIILDEGKVAESGRTREIVAKPRSRAAHQLLRAWKGTSIGFGRVDEPKTPVRRYAVTRHGDTEQIQGVTSHE